MRVLIEPEMEPHAAELYAAAEEAAGIQGFAAFDAAAKASYEQAGYLLVRGAFDPEQVAAAKAELLAMTLSPEPQCEGVYYEGTIRELLGDVSRGAAGELRADMALGEMREELPNLPAEQRANYVRKFMGFVEQHAPLASIAGDPGLGRILGELMHDEPVLFQDMAMIKPPRGREKPWHQDHAYFKYRLETRIVAAWVALDDVTAANGCMYLLPGEHRGGPRPHFLRRDWQLCDAEILGRRQVAAPMKAGDALLFDAKLPHGTPTNNSQRHRWALQLHYRPCNAVSITEDERVAIFGGEGLGVTC